MRQPSKSNKKELSAGQRKELLGTLKARFEKNMSRHKGHEWASVQAKLEANAEKLWSLNEMEKTGGEPDVVDHDRKTGEYIFYDCSAESPKRRRSICYDGEALAARKEHKPADSAVDMAARSPMVIVETASRTVGGPRCRAMFTGPPCLPPFG